MPLFLIKFLGLPRWVHAMAGAAARVGAFFLWLHFHDRGVIADHEANITAQVQVQTSEAADQASSAVVAKQTEVERRNDEARNAARDSDDPLKSGLDRLRH